MKQGLNTNAIKDLYIELSRLMDRYNFQLNNENIYATAIEIENLEQKIKNLYISEPKQDDGIKACFDLDEKGQIIKKIGKKNKYEGSSSHFLDKVDPSGSNLTSSYITCNSLKGVQFSFNNNINTKCNNFHEFPELSTSSSREVENKSFNRTNKVTILSVKVFNQIVDIDAVNLELLNFQKNPNVALLIFNDSLNNKDIHKLIAKLASCYYMRAEYQEQSEGKSLHVTRFQNPNPNKELDYEKAESILNSFKATSSSLPVSAEINGKKGADNLFIKYNSRKQKLGPINEAISLFLNSSKNEARFIIPKSTNNQVLHKQIAKLAVFYRLQPAYVGDGANKALHLQRNAKSTVPTDLNKIKDFISSCTSPTPAFSSEISFENKFSVNTCTTNRDLSSNLPTKPSISKISSIPNLQKPSSSYIKPPTPRTTLIQSKDEIEVSKHNANILKILKALDQGRVEHLTFDFTPENREFCKEVARLTNSLGQYSRYTGANYCKKLLVFKTYDHFAQFKADKKLESVSKLPWKSYTTPSSNKDKVASSNTSQIECNEVYSNPNQSSPSTNSNVYTTTTSLNRDSNQHSLNVSEPIPTTNNLFNSTNDKLVTNSINSNPFYYQPTYYPFINQSNSFNWNPNIYPTSYSNLKQGYELPLSKDFYKKLTLDSGNFTKPITQSPFNATTNSQQNYLYSTDLASSHSQPYNFSNCQTPSS